MSTWTGANTPKSPFDTLRNPEWLEEWRIVCQNDLGSLMPKNWPRTHTPMRRGFLVGRCPQ